MKTKVHSLIRTTIIIIGTVLLSFIFKHPILSLIITFTILQLIEETTGHAKIIKKINNAYSDRIANYLRKIQIKNMAIDIVTISIWFLLALWLFFFINS